MRETPNRIINDKEEVMIMNELEKKLKDAKKSIVISIAALGICVASFVLSAVSDSISSASPLIPVLGANLCILCSNLEEKKKYELELIKNME